MTLATSSCRTLSALSAGLLALGMLAACTPGSEPKPTPTRTALFSSDEEAFKAAEETYRAYLAVYNNLDTSDPDALEATREYVTGRYEASEREALSELQAEHWTRKGESTLANFTGVAYDRPDQIRARICSDVSATDVIDAQGNSVVSPSRPDRYALDVVFIIRDQSILLAEADAVEDRSCLASGS